MYEAAIKTASTGVYFAVPYMALLFKGLYYDRDLSCAEREAEVRGRNERIVFEKRERNGDSLPPLRNGGSFEPDADLSPVFGNRRRRSVWDL